MVWGEKNGNVAQEFPSTKWSSVHFRVSRWDQGSLRSPLYKMDFCIFEGFLYFKQPFCLHVCSCKVPHFVEASGCENHKSAPKKRGWVPWFCRDDALLHLWQVPHSVEISGPQSQVWLYKMGTPNPPMSLFWGIKKTYNFENHEKPIEKQWKQMQKKQSKGKQSLTKTWQLLVFCIYCTCCLHVLFFSLSFCEFVVCCFFWRVFVCFFFFQLLFLCFLCAI